MDWRKTEAFRQLAHLREKKWASGVDQYVQNIISECMREDAIDWKDPSNPQPHEKNPLEPEVKIIEIHGFIIVQIKLSEETNMDLLQVDKNSYKIVVSGLPSGLPFEVTLPGMVHRRGGKAILKDGVLEIRLVRHEDHEYVSLPIRKLD
ncbi:hypothetical protein [Ammoniphilus sp. YIM 78166]|uniref:hypothetical protein n=1 Tax=Ammoniphilus sp. YIM 78166 TaxID=1644106 RepID=UPI00106F4E1C|nr:hypothetical protein [Ammoniphilus sp. YIM 78166]